MTHRKTLKVRLTEIERRLSALESITSTIASVILPTMHNTTGQMIVQIGALNEAVKELQDAGSGDEWKYGRGEPID